MASEEYQEQPAANQPSSNPEEQESLEQQKSVVEQPDNITSDSEDIIEANNTESLTEEIIQVQSEVPEDNSEPISSVTRSPSDITEEEEQSESTISQAATEVVTDSPQEDKNKNWWDVILDKIRSFLPESMNNALSDWTLTGIISGLIVLILSISVILLPSRSSSEISPESAEIVSIPEQKIEITTNSTPTEETEETATPSNSSEIVSIPEQEIEITTNSTPTEEIEETATLSNSSDITSTPVEIETPETLITPKKPENLTIKTTPPPKPVITPEQSLFSSVQEKVNEITSQYAEELIVSGEADLLNSRLLIKVSDDWYKLNKDRQDKFANETFKRSQKFNLRKLEIQDLQNNLIARSPVVGNKMIILQRAN